MRVLVTRPQPAAAQSAARLREAGHEPILFPVTEAHRDPRSAFDALARNPAALAVTSAEAIRVLGADPTALAPHLSRHLYAVGKASAEAAAQAGFRWIEHGASDGAALAEAMHRAGETETLYLCGAPRAEGFERRAAKLGLRVEPVEIYHMRRIEPSEAAIAALEDKGFDAVLFYSAETVRAFFDLACLPRLAPTLGRARILCLSPAVAAAVADPINAVAASRPDEDSLLALLLETGIAQI